MKSLRKTLLEKLVKRRPQQALELSSSILSVSAIQLRLPPSSPLYSISGGESVELPLDKVIAPYVLEHGEWQTEELKFFQTHAPNSPWIFIDIGANIGLITRQVANRLPSVAAAVCIEPHPGNFRSLQRNLAHLNKCHPINAALGQNQGDLLFFEEENNSGNYSLNEDAMRGKNYRTSTVKCLMASEESILAPLPDHFKKYPLVWKSDTQGHDEIIATNLPHEFWSRVHCGVMEISRIRRPAFDKERLKEILQDFQILRFGNNMDLQVSAEEVLIFSQGTDDTHCDLFFSRN